MRLGVLVSGRGSNLEAVLTARIADLEPVLVISNRPGVRALEVAAAHGVPALVLRRRDFADAAARDAEVGRALADAGVDLALLTREEQVGLGLRPQHIPALDDDHVVRDAERVERGVDLGPAAGGGDAVRDPFRPQEGEQLAGARQRPSIGQELAEQCAVALLDHLGLVIAHRTSGLARDRAGEQAAAHPDPAVDAPAIDRQARLREGSLPREDMRIHRIDQRAVEVEDQRPGHRSPLGFRRSDPAGPAQG